MTRYAFDEILLKFNINIDINYYYYYYYKVKLYIFKIYSENLYFGL